jgi:hypothetical protein
MYTDLKYQDNLALDYQYTLNQETCRAKGKIKYFLREMYSGTKVHEERGNEGDYGGCILYPYMKIEN